MITIWKATLEVQTKQSVTMPRGAAVLCAAAQGDGICIWFRCDTSAPTEERIFYVYGTGHDMDSGADGSGGHAVGRYVGTAHLFGGKLVFHVFEGGA